MIAPHFRGETRNTLSDFLACHLGGPVQVRVRSEVSGNRGTGGDNARSVSGGRGNAGRLRGGAVRVSERAVVGLNVGQFILGASVMLKGSASLEGFRTATVFGCRGGTRQIAGCNNTEAK